MINIILLNLPYKVRGLTTKNSDETYTIFLNSRLTFEQQMKTYLHELLHIKNCDFDRTDVNVIENYTHESR